MVTDLTEAPSSVTACSGDVVTVSGRLQVHDGHYGRQYSTGHYELDGNPLSGRILTIERSGNSYSSTTASGLGGDNWSKGISSSVLVNTTYTYTVQFARANNTSAMITGLDSSPTRTFTITWIAAGAC